MKVDGFNVSASILHVCFPFHMAVTFTVLKQYNDFFPNLFSNGVLKMKETQEII